MSNWHYTANLLPVSGVLREHGDVPQSITVHRVTPDNIRQLSEVHAATPNYWADVDATFALNLEAQLTAWVPENTSWSDRARMFGDDMTDQLGIWRDENGSLCRINVLFCLSNPNLDNLRRFLNMPVLADCLLHDIQSESVFRPTAENWALHVRSCSAMRYLDDHSILDKLGTPSIG